MFTLLTFIILSKSSTSSVYLPHPSSNTSRFPSSRTSSLSSCSTFPTLIFPSSVSPSFHLSSTSSPPTFCQHASLQLSPSSG